MEYYRKFKEKDLIVKFLLNDEAVILAHKHREKMSAVIKIEVKDNENIIALYTKEFRDKVTPASYNNFVKQFLENPDYRTELCIGGEWNGSITYTDELTGINKKCIEAINRFNKKKKHKFKDSVLLHTYGQDKFSTMKLEQLSSVLGEEKTNALSTQFDNPKFLMSVMRWCVRGLSVEDAIRKVKTDHEVTINAKDSNTRRKYLRR